MYEVKGGGFIAQPHSHSGVVVSQMLRNSRIFYVCVVVLIFGIFLTALNVYELRKMQGDHFDHYHVPGGASPSIDQSADNRPVVWVSGKKMESGYLKHVLAVFQRLGFAIGDEKSRWDVMWTHDYPFTKLAAHVKNMRLNQRVNHWPGSGWVTNKGNLAKFNLSYVPRAFKMPKEKDELLQFSISHPNRLWVQKSNSHRGIKIRSLDELDLTKDGTFVQEFIQNPYIIDERKFDIGIYTIVTSIDPLRVYVYEGDCLIRFCSKDYYPFDAQDAKKYVVDDHYTPTWEVPSLNKFYSENYTYKQSLFAYFREKGVDVEKLFDRMRFIINDVYRMREWKFINSAKKYRSTSNFFEMVRFDFILDSQLNIYLMEVNMSPNLSSNHFPPNKLLYEQVIFNVLSLVGLADSVRTITSDRDIENMKVSARDINVNAEMCVSSRCGSCQMDKACKLCSSCLTPHMKSTLLAAYKEHLSRRHCRRVVPSPYRSPAELAAESLAQVWASDTSERNQLMRAWFYSKCKQDLLWCV